MSVLNPGSGPIDQVSVLRPALGVAPGTEVEVTERVYEYFLNVLPPVDMPFQWNGTAYGFGFAEGYEPVIAFRRDRPTGRYQAVLTDVMNPRG